MGFLTVFAIILSFSITLTILLKKKIEQVIPISVVGIILIIYVAGLFDNLKMGVNIVQALTIIQLIFIVIIIIKKDKKNELKELVKNIATPGLVLYILLFVLSIIINKNRIFEDYDEFNHWAVIIKNMFMYNTYGTNPESIVRFNEYPPFTAVFQYLFLVIQKVYREDTIIIAQNLLYFSIIIPVTKCISWDKSLRKLFLIAPLIIFLPMIFYENFFLDILVDGMLGVMFAYTIFVAFEEESNIKFKYMKILAGELMLCLTKTSGIGLAVLSIVIIFIKLIVDRKKDKQDFNKGIKAISIVILITLIFTSIWYIKVNNAEKRWDFKQYVEVDTSKKEYQSQIAKDFTLSVFLKQTITERNLTVFSVILIFICMQVYTVKKINAKGYKYYAWAMLISIPLYLIILLITYATIFETIEAQQLTCFDRYTSTILLAYSIFQMLVLMQEKEESFFRSLCLVIALIVALMPLENIERKYINGRSYCLSSNINRDIYTKIRKYTENIEPTDKILYIAGPKANMEYLTAMNEYEIMPITITATMVGVFGTQENFETTIKDYDYVFIYRIKQEQKETIKKVFLDENISNDTLYEVVNEDGKVILKQIVL